MKEIALSNGRITVVDDEDHTSLSKLAWQNTGGKYATHSYYTGDRIKSLYMHVLIAKWMGLVVPPGHDVDHKNRDALDNQRHNLRAVTRSMNAHNSDLRKGNTTGVCGVNWVERNRVWQARITVRGQRIHLGSFPRFEDAVAARLKAEVRYLGGEYTTNLPGPATDRAIN